MVADGSSLTGGTKAGTINSLGRHNVGLATGVALNANTSLGGMSLEFAVRNPGDAWPSYQALTPANLSGAIASLIGYSANDGLEMRVQITANGNDEYRRIQQISMPTNINPSLWTLDDASIEFQGPGSTDVVKIIRVSDLAELYSFTGSGLKTFTIGANFGTEVFIRREDSGGTVLMRTLPKTIFLKFGFNGNCPLFYGDEIQLAQSSDVALIKSVVDAYLDATISSRSSQVSQDDVAKNVKFIKYNV
jgi:hypothetical protein